MKRKLIYQSIAIISLVLCACNSDTKRNEKEHSRHEHKKGEPAKHPHKDHNKANHHMNKNSFEDLAKRFESEERTSWQKPAIVIQKLGENKGKKIADIGAGTGYFAFRLANLGAKVSAIDVDKRFIAFMEERIKKDKTSNLITKLVGYDNPELGEKEYDAVLIVDTYHHFNDKHAYLTHCFHGLKEGGILMNVDFKYEETNHGPPLDHRIAAEEVKRDLLKVGFTEVKIDQNTLEEQYIVTAKKKPKNEQQN